MTEITWATGIWKYKTTKNGELIKKFEDQYNISVNVELIGYPNFHETHPIIFSEAKKLNGRYDVVDTTYSWGIGPRETQLFEDLTGYQETDPIDSWNLVGDRLKCMVNRFGSLWGIPSRTAFYILHYRWDIYEEEGVSLPKTLDEFVENTKLLTRHNGEESVYGYAGKWGKPLNAACMYLDFLYRCGGELVSEDGESIMTCEEQSFEALELMRRLYKGGGTPKNLPELQSDDIIFLMKQGKLSQTIDTAGYALDYIGLPSYGKAANSASKITSKLNWMYPPTSKKIKSKSDFKGGYGNTWAHSIPKNSKKKDAAWKFIRFMSSPESDLFMSKMGNGAIRASTYNDEYFTSKYPGLTDTMKTAFDVCQFSPYPVYGCFPVLSDMVHDVILDKKNIREATDEAKTKLVKLMNWK